MRVFVAVWPGPEVVRQLSAIDRPVLPGLRWTTEDQWHVTLRFLGEIGGEELEGVKGALEPLGPGGPRGPVIARAGPAVARLGPAVARLGPAVLCLPVAGLDEVAAEVVARTAAFGTPVDDRRFRGHVTLARAIRGVKLRLPQPIPLVASWEVGEVTLVASALHPHGARYQVIGRYRLHDGPR